MTTTEIRNRPAAAERGPELSGAVAQQVADILAATQRPQEPAPPATRPAVAYRVPSPGVRYYF